MDSTESNDRRGRLRPLFRRTFSLTTGLLISALLLLSACDFMQPTSAAPNDTSSTPTQTASDIDSGGSIDGNGGEVTSGGSVDGGDGDGGGSIVSGGSIDGDGDDDEIVSGGSIDGGGGGEIASGGSIDGDAGPSVGSQPGAETPVASTTQTPSGTIGGLDVPAATPTSTGQIAGGLPGSVAFTVPADALQVAGRLAYVGSDNRIWTMTSGGTGWAILVDKPAGDEPPGDRIVNLNMSPSGKRMFYSVLNASGGQTRHFMLDLNGGAVTRQKYAGAWSNDSTHVATSVDGRLIVYNVETGQEENLGEGTSPGWTADNRLVVFRGGNVWLVQYPANTAADKQITSFPADGPDSWQFYSVPQYHYSGRIIFAGVQRKNLDANGNGAMIMAVNANGEMVTLAGPGGSAVRYMSLAPSGTRLAYAQETNRSGCMSSSSLSMVNAAGGNEQKVNIPEQTDNFGFMHGVTWSPDQHVVYAYTERTCVSGSPVDSRADRLFMVDPAAPANPRYIGDGSFPAYIRVWALGQSEPGQAAVAAIFAGLIGPR